MPASQPLSSSHPVGDRRTTEIQGRQEHTVKISHLRGLPSMQTEPRPPRKPPQRRRELKPLDAVVFLPPGTPAAGLWTDACGEYVQRRGYRLAAVCSKWGDAMRMIFDGLADVVVVGRRDHLPKDRTPRVDVVVEEKQDVPPTLRRPKRLS